MAFGSHFGLAQEMKGRKNKAKNASSATQKHAARSLTEEQKVNHFLDRTTFGPRVGDVERVMKLGWQKYLDEQLHPERIPDDLVERKLKALESIYFSNQEIARRYPPPQVVRQVLKSRGLDLPGFEENQNQNRNDRVKADGSGDQQAMENKRQGEAPQFTAEDFKKRRQIRKALEEMGYNPPQQVLQELQAAKIMRAVYSEKQLQEVMTDFWFNHFNVFAQKGADRILTTSYERDVIRPRVFGKFEDLLRATAESPAMLFYLDNWMSSSPKASGPDFRNFDQVRQPQRTRRGLNENYAREIMELHTLGVDGGYTQKDVQEVARCFTGWTLRKPRAGAESFFNPRMHDDGEKIVLGHRIPAGGGKKDGETVIKILARHPSTAKFISTKLARKFVSDNPPASLVERMARTFSKTEGDIREVLRVMFNSPEFWAPENYRAKIKTPFEMTVSAVRAIGAETNGNPAFHRWIAQMGEGLFLAQAPTGYPDTSEHWVNTGALLVRMNFALALSANRIPGTRVNLDNMGISMNTSQRGQAIDSVAKILLRGEMSPQTRATIDQTLNEQSAAQSDTAQVDTARLVGLILGSPEFQRQ
jgi:uncharacterized protein (DUF1800 family)